MSIKNNKLITNTLSDLGISEQDISILCDFCSISKTRFDTKIVFPFHTIDAKSIKPDVSALYYPTTIEIKLLNNIFLDKIYLNYTDNFFNLTLILRASLELDNVIVEKKINTIMEARDKLIQQFDLIQESFNIDEEVTYELYNNKFDDIPEKVSSKSDQFETAFYYKKNSFDQPEELSELVKNPNVNAFIFQSQSFNFKYAKVERRDVIAAQKKLIINNIFYDIDGKPLVYNFVEHIFSTKTKYQVSIKVKDMSLNEIIQLRDINLKCQKNKDIAFLLPEFCICGPHKISNLDDRIVLSDMLSL